MTEQNNNFFSKNLTFVIFIIGFIGLASLIIMAPQFGQGTMTGNVVNDKVQNEIPQKIPSAKQDIDMGELVDDDAIKGDPDAPVTIVEFSDYECPFCTRFFTDTLPQIQKEYIDTGKVRLVYRDFPLGFHQNAQKAAEAAECAGEQGKYYEMHDQLFEFGVSGGVSTFKEYAKALELNTDEFNECLDSGEMAAEVKKDLADGQDVGVTGTPGFIINGRLVSGAQPYENFKQIIEAEL